MVLERLMLAELQYRFDECVCNPREQSLVTFGSSENVLTIC